MYGIFATFFVKLYSTNVGKYASPMDPMGKAHAQAVLVGYASDETPELMPLTQQLASAMAAEMDQPLGFISAIYSDQAPAGNGKTPISPKEL